MEYVRATSQQQSQKPKKVSEANKENNSKLQKIHDSRFRGPGNPTVSVFVSPRLVSHDDI